MQKCHLTQDFLKDILLHIPAKIIHYNDKELAGFFLEYRLSGKGTWYFRYRDAEKKMRYLRMGNTNTMDAALARECAYRIANIVREGGDPQKEVNFAVKTLLSKILSLSVICPMPR